MHALWLLYMSCTTYSTFPPKNTVQTVGIACFFCNLCYLCSHDLLAYLPTHAYPQRIHHIMVLLAGPRCTAPRLVWVSLLQR